MAKCEHCLLEFNNSQTFTHEDKCFCCHGCLGVYRFIHEEGLATYYDKRSWSSQDARAVSSQEINDISSFKELVREVEVEGAVKDEVDMEMEINVYIEDIKCASCVWLVERVLKQTKGIRYARLNYATNRATIRWNQSEITLKEVLSRIYLSGYRPKPYSISEGRLARNNERRDLLIRLGTALFLSSQIMIYSVALYAGYFHGISDTMSQTLKLIAMFLTIPILFYSGMPLIKNTLSSLMRIRFNMDSLIILGAGSAFLYSLYAITINSEVYFDTSAMLITLILLGRYIELTAKSKASETLELLAELAPKSAVTVTLDSAGTIIQERFTKDIKSINKGELIEVKPGEKVPLDGIVIMGQTETDESLITGESRDISKRVGDRVIGGSLNTNGSIVFEVTHTGEDTMLASIVRSTADAQAQKPEIQNLADKIVGVFVPLIIVLAVGTLIWQLLSGTELNSAMMVSISVLVIACPCSLGLATPLAVLVFTTMAGKAEVLVKSGDVVESAAGVTSVVFDKTGTITKGQTTLASIYTIGTLSQAQALAHAVAVEAASEHSIAKAICKSSVPATEYLVENFVALPGRGVKAKVNKKEVLIGNMALMNEHEIDTSILPNQTHMSTVAIMAVSAQLEAVFNISDTLRPEAQEVVRHLHELGIKTMLLSGDADAVSNKVASEVGISNVRAEVTPQMKREILSGLNTEGEVTLMAGDGINDAPALIEAGVGVAMGRGTDIARASGDAVLMTGTLKNLPYFITLSRKSYTIIKQNIFWAFFYNLLALPLAMAGLMHPIIAAGAMVTSSLIVVGNSLRIKNYKPEY